MKLSSRVFAVAGAVFFTLSTVGAQAKPLPDELNYPKSKQVYETALARAQALRSDADAAQSALEKIRQSIADLEADQRAWAEEKSRNISDIEFLRSENPRLEQANRDMRQEISSAQTRISVLQREIRDYDSRYQQEHAEAHRLYAVMTQLSKDIENANARLDQLDQEVRRDRITFDDVNARHEALRRTLHEGPREERDLENTHNQIRGRIHSTRERLDADHGSKNALNAQLPGLQQRAAAERAQLGPVQERLNEITRRRNQAQQTVDSATGSLQGAEQRLNQAQADAQNQQGRAESLRQSLSQAEARLNGFDQETAAKQEELNQKNARLEAVRAEMTEIRQRCPNFPRCSDANEMRRMQELQREGADLSRAIADLNNQLRHRQNEKSQLEATIQRARTEIPEAERAAGQARERASAARQEIEKLQGQVREAQAALQTLNNEYSGVKQDYDSKARALHEIEGQIAGISRQVNELEKSIRATEERLNELERSAKEVGDRLAGLRQEIERAKQNIERSGQRLREAEEGLRRSERAYAATSRRLSEMNGEYASVETEYKSVMLARDQLGQELESREKQVTDLLAQVDSLSTRIAENERAIPANSQRVADLETRNRQIATDTLTADRELAALEGRRATAETENSRRQTLAQQAESFAEQKYQAMIEVKTRYDNLIAKAKADGSRQGEAGREIGQADGRTEGGEVGRKSGHIKGESDGLEFGFEKGKTDGFNRGKSEGYHHGFHEPKNREHGYNAGLEEGARQADTEGRAEIPKGLQEKREELLRHAPTQAVELDNSMGLGSRSDALAQLFMDPLTATSHHFLSANIEMDAAKFVAAVLPTDAGAACAYQGGDLNKSIVLGKMQCSHEYDDMNEACRQAYTQSYQAHYTRGYTETYGGAYTGACVAAYTPAFKLKENVRVQEGYDKTYGPTYAEYDAKGAADARSVSYAEGKNFAYTRDIAGRRSYYRGVGHAQAVEFFAKNPVVLLGDVAVVKTSEGSSNTIVAGDELQLKVRFANYGQVASLRGQIKVKVQLQSSSATTPAAQEWVDIVALPGQAVSTVNNVTTITVKKGIGAETIGMKILARLSDGTIAELPLSFRTAEHVSTEVDTIDSGISNRTGYLNPEWNKETAVNVRLRNSGVVDPNEPLSLELSAVGVPANWVQLPKPSAKIEARDIKRGERTGVLKLSYKVVAGEARGKKIKFILTAKYKGNVSMKTAFEAQVK